MLHLLAALALAEVPPDVTPVAAPPDIGAQYAAWARGAGRPTELACDALWPGRALLCFKVVEGRLQRWVTLDDLARWGVSTAGLRAELAARAPERPPLRAERVQGMDATYLISDAADIRALTPLLRPQALTEALGAPQVMVALPAEGLLLAWRAGDPELDRVMAVAVRELHDGQPGSVSPVIHRWDGARWVEFGEAVPQKPAF